MDLKEEYEKLKNKKGKEREEILRSFKNFVLNKEGEEGLEKLQKELQNYKLSIDLQKRFSPFNWTNEWEIIFIFLVTKKVFLWTDKDFFNLGEYTVKTSFIFKTSAINYLISIDTMLKAVPYLWNKHFDFGKMVSHEINKEESFLILRLYDFDFHPVYCNYLKGYLFTAGRLCLTKKEISIKETRCIHRGDEFHEFKVSW